MDATVSTVLYIISVPFSEETLFINDQLFNFQFIIKSWFTTNSNLHIFHQASSAIYSFV